VASDVDFRELMPSFVVTPYFDPIAVTRPYRNMALAESESRVEPIPALPEKRIPSADTGSIGRKPMHANSNAIVLITTGTYIPNLRITQLHLHH
jgi:hypothetical protein